MSLCNGKFARKVQVGFFAQSLQNASHPPAREAAIFLSIHHEILIESIRIRPRKKGIFNTADAPQPLGQVKGKIHHIMLLSLPCFTLVVNSPAQITNQTDVQSADSFTESAEKNHERISKELAGIRLQKEPILKFMSCVKRVIEINRYLSDSGNLGEWSSSFAEDPKTPEERHAKLAAVKRNQMKIEVTNLKHD